MKILLIYANFIKTPRPALPIGMAYIAAALAANGYEVSALDLSWERKYHVSVINKLKEIDPDVVGVSFRNLDNVTFLEPVSYAENLKRIVQCCKKYSKAKVVLGGTGFSVEPYEIFDYVKADFGLIGEGETSFVSLMKLLEQGAANYEEVPGLTYFKNHKITMNPLKSDINLDENFVPNRKIYSMKYYNEVLAPNTDKKNESYPAYETVQSKRGCGLHCSYCVIKKVQGNGVRVKDPKLVVEEIRDILENNRQVQEIEFVDATFNFPYNHAVAVCKEIIKSGLKFKWNCEISPVNVTEELVNLLEQSGCTRVELGTDSLSDEGLISLQKGFDFNQVLYVDELLHKTSIVYTHCVFLGAPGETPGVMRTVMERWKMLKANQIFGTLGIRIYKNTALYDRAIADGLIEKEHNPISPTFYLEHRLLDDMKIFDEIQTFINQNESWYLYWRLEKDNLRQMVKESLCKIKQYEEDLLVV